MKKYYVYLIKATNSNGLVKIGRSSRIDDRLRELECPPENVIQLADCMIEIRMKATEKVLHKKYAKWRVPQSEMFNLSDEQIKECSLILQSINAKAVEARQAAHDATVAEYERKAAEQAERKAAAEREALERDKKLWPVENGVLRDPPTLADSRLGESTWDPNRTHQGRPGAPTKPYPFKQDLKPAPDKGEEAQFVCEIMPTAFAWIAGACFLAAGLVQLTAVPSTNQFEPLFDVQQHNRPRTSGD